MKTAMTEKEVLEAAKSRLKNTVTSLNRIRIPVLDNESINIINTSILPDPKSPVYCYELEFYRKNENSPWEYVGKFGI